MLAARFRRPSHATVVAYVALVVAVGGGTAYAATGGTFVLGKANSAKTATTLTRTTAGPALSLGVKAGSAPLSVNSKVKVPNLNSDLLDGLHSTAFQPKIAKLVFTPLAMTNGWSGNCWGDGLPGIAVGVDGTVHLHGGFCAPGTPTGGPFTIPVQFRPSKTLYLTVDTCNASTGRIVILPAGTVSVEDDPNGGSTPPSRCFVSLAGVSYTLPY